jgi:hypothetical protein
MFDGVMGRPSHMEVFSPGAPYKLAPGLTAPPPCGDGYWHYIYTTCHMDSLEWYGGKHSTDNLDDGYLGSGNWVHGHPERGALEIEIVEFHASEVEAYAAEAALITWDIIDGDPLCRNLVPGGTGFTSEEMKRFHADPAYRTKYRAGMEAALPKWQAGCEAAWPKYLANREAARPKMLANLAAVQATPEWLSNVREGCARRGANPKYREKHRERGARHAAEATHKRDLDAPRIFELMKNGFTQKAIATTMGRSEPYIRAIQRTLTAALNDFNNQGPRTLVVFPAAAIDDMREAA